MNEAMHPETVIGLFVDRCERYADRPFVVATRPDGIARWSYDEAAQRIAGVADWLSKQGLKKGDRIAHFMDRGDAPLWLFLACAALGVVPVPFAPGHSLGALERLIEQCNIVAVATDAAHLDKVESLETLLISFDAPGPQSKCRQVQVNPVEEPLSRLKELSAQIKPEDMFVFQPTSGSTGTPKIVMRRNLTFPRAGRMIAAGQEPEDLPLKSGLLIQALTHGIGHYTLSTILYLGGCLCIPTAIDAEVSLEEVEALEPNSLFLAPRTLHSLYEQHNTTYGSKAAEQPFCSKNLRWASLGGAVPDENELADLERRGVEVVEGYGATEVSCVTSSVRGDRKPGSPGKILPDIEVRIAEDGEILVKSRYGMAGYLDQEELTRSCFTEDGFFRTGDLGAVEEDGTLRIIGRKKDVFNTSEGSNIYPVRIEEALESLPSIRSAILIGDARPFMSAIVVLDGEQQAEGIHEPSSNPDLYERVWREIAELNQTLEEYEKVERVAIFASEFPSQAYGAVGNSKIRRDRKVIAQVFADIVDRLYSESGSAFAREASC